MDVQELTVAEAATMRKDMKFVSDTNGFKYGALITAGTDTRCYMFPSSSLRKEGVDMYTNIIPIKVKYVNFPA